MLINELVTELVGLLNAGQLVSAVLSRPRRGQDAPAARIDLRPVVIQNQACLQLIWRTDSGEQHRNLTPAELAEYLVQWLGPVYREFNCATTNETLAVFASKPNGSLRVRRREAQRAPVDAQHNRSKQYLIPAGTPCGFLEAIGVMTATGQVRARAQAKFRQINRFLEIVNDVLPELPPTDPLRVIDFGCGKSYLTFALHHLLTVIHGRSVTVIGLDLMESVVADCRQIAQRLELPGLEFHVGRIDQFDAADDCDLVVSLHACDTATDDVLAQAIQWQVPVILSVPCCQHEVAPQIHNQELDPLLDHGILRERFAALATDAMRAECLQQCGYKTQIMEFIDLEHTAKNLLIRAVRRRDAAAVDPGRLERLRQSLGVKRMRLLTRLAESGLPEAPR